MALTALSSNTITGERSDSVITLPMTDSTTITAGDFVELSSGKLIKSVTTLSKTLSGIAKITKTSGDSSQTGLTEYLGIVTEGIVKVRGLVEGSGGTYTTALAVGTKVSFHYDATAGYGQFVVASDSAPIGIVVEGSVASSGTTDDQWDYVLIQLDFERYPGGGSSIADGTITPSKTSTGVPAQRLATKQWLDNGTFSITSTETTAVIDWTYSLSTTSGVKVFLQALTVTGTIPIPGTLTHTNFTVTGANSQTGVWFAWIPEDSY